MRIKALVDLYFWILERGDVMWKRSIEVLISSHLKCSEHTFVSRVISHCFPASRRIAWIHCFLLMGDFGNAKHDTLSPVDDFTPFWWHLGTQQPAGIVKTLLKRRQELGSPWYWYVLQTNRGPTSPDFAQLVPGCPSGPPYLHSVYAYFNKYGGLSFLLKCNYNTRTWGNNIPPFTQNF